MDESTGDNKGRKGFPLFIQFLLATLNRPSRPYASIFNNAARKIGDFTCTVLNDLKVPWQSHLDLQTDKAFVENKADPVVYYKDSQEKEIWLGYLKILNRDFENAFKGIRDATPSQIPSYQHILDYGTVAEKQGLLFNRE